MAWHGVQYKVELVLVIYKTTLFYDTIVSASVVSFYKGRYSYCSDHQLNVNHLLSVVILFCG